LLYCVLLSTGEAVTAPEFISEATELLDEATQQQQALAAAIKTAEEQVKELRVGWVEGEVHMGCVYVEWASTCGWVENKEHV
jgi:hypothetical protein